MFPNLVVGCVAAFIHDDYIVILAATLLPSAYDMLPVQGFCEQTGNVALVGPAFLVLVGLSLTVVESTSFGD